MSLLQTKNKLISNFLSLSSLQIASYVFPLLTIPYLVRVLGVENYGLLSFAGGIVFYFNILVAYGFGLTATKDISIHRGNTKKLSKIFSAVLTTQIILLLVSFMIFLVMIFSIESIRDEKLLYIFSFIAALSNTLFPIFFFQGIEQMKYITIITVLSRIVSTSMIFIVIHDASDYYLVPAVYAFFSIFSTFYSIYFIEKKFYVKFTFVPLKRIFKTLKDGRHIFVSNMGITLYDNSVVIILGFLTNMTIVGYYAVAQKLIKAVISLSQPIYKTVYPRIMYLSKKSKNETLLFIKKVVVYSSIINLFIFLVTFLFAEPILILLFGEKVENSILLLKIFSILPLVVGLNNIIGVQTLIAFNYQYFLSKITIYVGLISIPFTFLFIFLYGPVGAVVMQVTVESVLLLIISIFLYRHDINVYSLKKVQNE